MRQGRDPRRGLAAAAQPDDGRRPHADVVLVNPTHVAVALRYDPARGAPRVVAKGADDDRRADPAIAAEARVPMVADIPLARALYTACDIGQEIPAGAVQRRGAVLAFVMTLNARSRRRAQPAPHVPSPRLAIAQSLDSLKLGSRPADGTTCQDGALQVPGRADRGSCRPVLTVERHVRVQSG